MFPGDLHRFGRRLLAYSIVAVTLTVLDVSVLLAQGFPARPGQRVRVTAPTMSDNRPVGTLAVLGPAALSIRLDKRLTLLRVPFHQLHCLEASVGPDRQAGRVLGSILGAVGWIAVMTIADRSYDGTTGPNMGYIWTPAFAFLGWHVGGARLSVGEQWLAVARPSGTPRWDCYTGAG